MEKQLIGTLVLTAKTEYFRVIDNFIRELAQHFGIKGDDLNRLALSVEEACLNVFDHAYLPGEDGKITVSFARGDGSIVISIEDTGLPFDMEKTRMGEGGIGSLLMRSFVDETSFINLGKRGKRVELTKRLSYKDINSYLTESEKNDVVAEDAAPLDAPVTIRFLDSSDAVNLARCFYRVYGYTYSGDFIYYPEKIREKLEAGTLKSVVATTEAGEIIGHFAMVTEHVGSKVGEVGQAVVDPRFRGRKLFERLKGKISEHACENGIYGLYSEAVTVHPFTQKGNLSMGAHEIGMMFGYSPQTTQFKAIKEAQTQRNTAMLMYKKTNEEPEQPAYPPFHHESMVRKIYSINGLNRSVISAREVTALPELPSSSVIDVKVEAEWGHAYLNVRQYGEDFWERFRSLFRQLCVERVDTLYADLPIASPFTASMSVKLESLGFFFSGIVPELRDGDVFRLQYLNNIRINPDKIVAASDFGKELLAYIASQAPE